MDETKTAVRTRRSSTNIKERINCLMAWREQQKIVCKEPKNTDNKNKADEFNVLTKRHGKTWHKQLQ